MAPARVLTAPCGRTQCEVTLPAPRSKRRTRMQTSGRRGLTAASLLLSSVATLVAPCDAFWPTFGFFGGAASSGRETEGDAEPLTGLAREPLAKLEVTLHDDEEEGGQESEPKEPENQEARAQALAAAAEGRERDLEAIPEGSAGTLAARHPEYLEVRGGEASQEEALPPPLLLHPPLPRRAPQCRYAGPMEESSDLELEALLVEASCPFVAAFFSGSSPLAQTEGLAALEREVAASFPQLRYYRVDADTLSMRAFLQWDIAFLPTFVVYTPPEHPGYPGNWYRWNGNGTSPYDLHTVAGFIQRAAGLRPSNATKCARLAGPVEGLPRRGAEAWTQASLLGSWVLVGLAALQRAFGRPLGGL